MHAVKNLNRRFSLVKGIHFSENKRIRRGGVQAAQRGLLPRHERLPELALMVVQLCSCGMKKGRPTLILKWCTFSALPHAVQPAPDKSLHSALLGDLIACRGIAVWPCQQ